MTTRKRIDQRAASRNIRGERVKGEVYRQMFLLEEGRPGAAIGLAVTLLRAWMDAASKSKGGDENGWLQKVSAICVEMIEASTQSAATGHHSVE